MYGRRRSTPQGLAEDEEQDEEQDSRALLTIKDDKRRNASIQKNKTASRGGPRMKNLDGARGIGVLTVVLYHMGFSMFKNAWLCISFFFTLSGFLITAITVEAFERKGRVEILKFYAKRVSRLFPALFGALIVIAFSQRFRDDDGVTFGREKIDLLYSAFFLTNYNLIYNNKDDYFDAFAQPSITRHMWTLSIEEQYYIIWPLIIYLITNTFGRRNEKTDPELEGGSTTGVKTASHLQPHMRRCFVALSVGEVIVIFLSFVSSWPTINKLGISAAYYSTLCRMGDVACGGLVYNLLRLHPELSRRYLCDPTVSPMSFRFRLLLEIMTLCSIFMATLVPMIPIPTEQLLPIYFAWLRLPLGLAATMFRVAGILQLREEPLPSWAFATRFLSSKGMMSLGVASYSIYLFHWPIIVMFADRYNAGIGVSSDDELLFGLKHTLKNGCIMCASVLLGILSYWYYEKPLVEKSIRTPAWKTIVCGFCGMGLTSALIVILTRNVEAMPDLRNDIELVTKTTIQDDRFTPVYLGIKGNHLMAMFNQESLDDFTRSAKSSLENTKKMRMGYDFMKIREEKEDLHRGYGLMKIREAIMQDEPSERIARDRPENEGRVIMMCRDVAPFSPCIHEWPQNTTWVWLGPEICDNDDISIQSTANSTQNIRGRTPAGATTRLQAESKFDEERCEENLNIIEVSVDGDYSKHFMLEAALLEIDNRFPGRINRHTIDRLRHDFQLYIEGMQSSNGWGDLVTITVAGESVAEFIGMNWDETMKSLDTTDMMGSSLPRTKMFNMANSGFGSIGYYACVSALSDSLCSNLDQSGQSLVFKTLPMTKPDIFVVHDTHFALGGRENNRLFVDLKTTYARAVALNNMLLSAKENGLKNLVFMTISANDKNNQNITTGSDYWIEMQEVLSSIEILGCSPDDPNSLLFTVLDWAHLSCPTLFSSKECPREAHGFPRLLYDGIHPTGQGGKWMSDQALALLLSHISTLLPAEMTGGQKLGLEQTLNGDLLAQKILSRWEKHVDDQPQNLSDMITSYYVCPVMEADATLNSKVDAMEFPKYHRYNESKFYVPSQ